MPVIVVRIVSVTGSSYLALMIFTAVSIGLFLCSTGMRYRRALKPEFVDLFANACGGLFILDCVRNM